MQKIIQIVIALYKYLVSPILFGLGCRCRFHPSCSEYTKQAFIVHRPIKALYLSVKRILKCGPWSVGGIDEVPLEVLYK